MPREKGVDLGGQGRNAVVVVFVDPPPPSPPNSYIENLMPRVTVLEVI